jgi:amino acid transporter
MIYGITAFAGFEAAAALGEEAKNTRRSVPASTIWIVIITGIFYLLVVCAETFAAGRQGIAAGFLRTRRPAAFKTLGRVFMPADR